MLKILLSKPLNVHGKQVEELELRDLNNGDAIDLGDPFVINADESFEFKNNVIAKYIVRLASIPMSSVREMDTKDFWKCKMEIVSFLGMPAQGS